MPSGSSAQQFLAIDTIREDVATLKNGGLRVVLMCSSLNFALKSADEQDAIIFQYQNFLNSLDFPLQFLIHSRRLNIAPYLESLRTRYREEGNDLLKIQITEYTEFIRTFTENVNIMSKTFYVVVPFTPPLYEQEGIFKGVLATLGLAGRKDSQKNDSFIENKNQIWQRVETIIQGLRSFGIRAIPLNTEELVELFYGLYNPTEFEKSQGAEAENVLK